MLNERGDGRTEKFKLYFPNGNLSQSERSNLTRCSGSFNRAFGSPLEYFIINHIDQSRTFALTSRLGNVFNLTLLDENPQGKIVGDGLMFATVDLEGRLEVNPLLELAAPYVLGTRTVEDELRKGLGIRRLEAMNAFARTLFDTPIHSYFDRDSISDAQIKVWEKLVSLGKAKPDKQGTYCFV